MNEILLRLEELLFLSAPEVAVVSAEEDSEAIRIGVRYRTPGAECPSCGAWSNRVHGSYLRFPADLPSAGRRVVLCLHVRRFACPEASCERRTFVEQVPGLTRRHSRWTERLRSTLAEVGLALAGRAGARIADVFGILVSRSTVLRLVDALPEPQPRIPRVVGVDEYAMRKGRVYGTVLVDVETGRPVDLLPDREAATVAAWLTERPGIEVICRDRAPFFAEGARTGAPTALQVADRFHLWHNLGEAAERCVSRHRSCLRAPFTLPAQGTATTPQALATDGPTPSPWPTGHRFADRTREKHATVQALLAKGHSRRAIGRQLGMTHRTVKRLADAAAPEDLFQGQWQNRPTKLDDFRPYLHERWAEGCTNAWTLWEEIKAHGYAGGYGAVRAYLRPFRGPAPADARPPTPRTVARWILTRPEALPENERLKLKSVLTHCPELDALTRHVRGFAQMLTQLQGDQLPQWIAAVRADDLPSLHTFANGLERDLAAVTAGLTLPWNSGIVEGHVNRIKMIKRQMFSPRHDLARGLLIAHGFEALGDRALVMARIDHEEPYWAEKAAQALATEGISTEISPRLREAIDEEWTWASYPMHWCTREEIREVSNEAQKIYDDIRHGRLIIHAHADDSGTVVAVGTYRDSGKSVYLRGENHLRQVADTFDSPAQALAAFERFHSDTMRPGPAPVTDTEREAVEARTTLGTPAADPEPPSLGPEMVPTYAADPGDHDAILNQFLATHGDWDKWRTWSDDTTHAIHESQTLRIERVHEAHPRETAWTIAAYETPVSHRMWHLIATGATPAPVLQTLLHHLAEGDGWDTAISGPVDEKTVTAATKPLTDAGWKHTVDGRWIRWTNLAGDAGVQFDAFAAQTPHSTLATWTVWAGPGIDHPTWTLTASPHTPSSLLADLTEDLAHGTGTRQPNAAPAARTARLGTAPPAIPPATVGHTSSRTL